MIERILSDGFYAIFHRYWQTEFPDDQLAVIDGNQFLTEPWKPLEELQKFVGVQQFINENNFVISKSGLPCFRQNQTAAAGSASRNLTRRKSFFEYDFESFFQS